MSNQYNDMLVDRAMDIVDEAMQKNPTIPEEARQQLYKEEYEKLCQREPMDYEPEEPTGHVIPMTDEQLLQHEESFINSFTE